MLQNEVFFSLAYDMLRLWGVTNPLRKFQFLILRFIRMGGPCKATHKVEWILSGEGNWNVNNQSTRLIPIAFGTAEWRSTTHSTELGKGKRGRPNLEAPRVSSDFGAWAWVIKTLKKPPFLQEKNKNECLYNYMKGFWCMNWFRNSIFNRGLLVKKKVQLLTILINQYCDFGYKTSNTP